jgi:hypothetical protein
MRLDLKLDDAFSFSIRPYRLVTSLVSPVIQLNLHKYKGSVAC